MNLELHFTEYFQEPIEEVWRAITDPGVLALWLMANDFEPGIGKRFTLRNNLAIPGWRGWVECEVLELQPPTRMVWSWSDGDGERSHVVFELASEGGGTKLSLHHTGPTTKPMTLLIAERWPMKLRGLRAAVASMREDGGTTTTEEP